MAQCSPNATNGSPQGVVARCSPNATQGLTPDSKAHNSPVPHRLALFSRELATKAYSRSTIGHLRAVTKPVQALGQSPQLNWRLPTTMPQRLQSHKRQQGHKRLQDHKRSINPTTQPSRVPRTQEKQAQGLELAESPRRTQTYAPNARGKYFSLKFHQS